MDLAPITIIIVVVVLIGAIAIFSAIQAQKRREALERWAHARGLTFRAAKDRSMDERFRAFACLQRGSNRYAYNLLEGAFENRPFLGFDYHYETRSRDSKGRRRTHHHYFSAAIVGCELPLRPLAIRPEGLFDKVSEFFGFDDIDFESAEFSRRFHVKSPDRRWAYDVLHARTIEFLLSQPVFTLEFDRHHVIAYDGSKFDASEFESAARVVCGILDRLPAYLVRQLEEES